MMRRLLPHPLLTLALAVVWLLLVNSAAFGQLVLGLLLGWAIPFFTRRFWPEQLRIRRPLTALRFIAVVLYDILVANMTVARLILGRPQGLRPAFIVMPLDLTSDVAISLLANTICLTPGTVSAQLAPDRKSLLIHALDVADADALVDTLKQRYEAPLKEVFETC